MKSINEFVKLYTRNIPVHKHFDYYVQQIAKVDPSILDEIKYFEELEEILGDESIRAL